VSGADFPECRTASGASEHGLGVLGVPERQRTSTLQIVEGMERGRRYDQRHPRDMRRTTLTGDGPATAQVEAASSANIRMNDPKRKVSRFWVRGSAWLVRRSLICVSSIAGAGALILTEGCALSAGADQ
jgi:hypothetical protein